MSQENLEAMEVEKTEADLLDHEYDGIREYDNPTPGWWVMLFILTIVFAALYIAYYFAPMEERSIYAAYTNAKTESEARELEQLGNLNTDENSLVGYMNTPKYVGIGKAIFKGNCVTCHGAEGQGSVGPNLTDDKYKNVEKITDLTAVITNGANNGAMPAWSRGPNALKPSQIIVVAAYVASLRGQNVPGPGALADKESHVIPPWPKYNAAASAGGGATSVPAAK